MQFFQRQMCYTCWTLHCRSKVYQKLSSFLPQLLHSNTTINLLIYENIPLAKSKFFEREINVTDNEGSVDSNHHFQISSHELTTIFPTHSLPVCDYISYICPT